MKRFDQPQQKAVSMKITWHPIDQLPKDGRKYLLSDYETVFMGRFEVYIVDESSDNGVFENIVHDGASPPLVYAEPDDILPSKAD